MPRSPAPLHLSFQGTSSTAQVDIREGWPAGRPRDRENAVALYTSYPIDRRYDRVTPPGGISYTVPFEVDTRLRFRPFLPSPSPTPLLEPPTGFHPNCSWTWPTSLE